MAEYLFIFGNTPELAKAEILTVLDREKISFEPLFSNGEVLAVKTQQSFDTDFLMKTLGGTVKIAEVCTEISEKDNVAEKIFTVLLQGGIVENTKITFGLSSYSGVCLNDLNHLNREIKDRLEEAGYKARFILPTEGKTLSSVVIVKQKVKEIILVKNGEKLLLAKTLAVQDFEDWGKRDFGRPEADPKTGMLPPKVARMMVNLGSWKLETGNLTLLDPFCGVGTILAEAMMMMMEYEVIGADISKIAIQKTQKNLEWLKINYQLPMTNFQLFQGDATHMSEKIPVNSVDMIVTEPYLGPAVIARSEATKQSQRKTIRLPRFARNDEIKNIILGLDKLYIGCLREWWKILKPGGVVVMAFPSFKSPAFAKASAGKEFFVKKALDSCENLGYTLVAGPYRYHRFQAIVVRNIYILAKK